MIAYCTKQNPTGTQCDALFVFRSILPQHIFWFHFFIDTMRLEANRLEDRVADGICDLRKDVLNVFVVDCPIEIECASGTEIFGVVCEIPECCTECILQ